MKEQVGVIVSNNVISRIGIRTMLGVIGGDFRLIEFVSIKEAQEHFKYNYCDFIILFEDILTNNLTAVSKEIRNLLPKVKLLYIGNKIQINNPDIRVVDTRKDQETILQDIKEFVTNTPKKSVWSEEDTSCLSERELDVLKQVALGCSNKLIAEQLHISIYTVITHRKNITEKLGIKTISGLTVYAIMNKLIDPEDVK